MGRVTYQKLFYGKAVNRKLRDREQHPEYGTRIAELKKALDTATATSEAYPPQLTAVIRVPFSRVRDEQARDFLGNILAARLSKQPGSMDYDINAAEEASAMSQEIGLPNGLQDPEAEKVTLPNAVGAVLDGRLRVKYQPQE